MNSTIPFFAIVGVVFWWLLPREPKRKSNPFPLSKHKLSDKEISNIEKELYEAAHHEKRRFRKIIKITEKERKEIAEEYANGISTKEISKHHKIDKASAFYIFREYGVPIRDRTRPLTFPPNVRQQIAKDYKDGRAMDEIRKHYEASDSTILKIAKEYQLPMRVGLSKLAPETREKIITLYKNGAFFEDICEKFNISVGQVQRVLTSANIPGRFQKWLTPEIKSKIYYLHKQGHSRKEIAAQLSIPYAVISQAIFRKAWSKT